MLEDILQRKREIMATRPKSRKTKFLSWLQKRSSVAWNKKNKTSVVNEDDVSDGQEIVKSENVSFETSSSQSLEVSPKRKYQRFEHFIELPTDVKKPICGYLSPKEAIYLSMSCKAVQSDLALTVIREPYRLLRSLANRPMRGGRRRINAFPHARHHAPDYITRLFLHHRNNNLQNVILHSAKLTFRWETPFLGDAHMQDLFILGNKPSDDAKNFHCGRLAAHCPKGKVDEDNPKIKVFTLRLKPKAGETYHLWCHLAGQGRVCGVSTYYLVYTDENTA